MAAQQSTDGPETPGQLPTSTAPVIRFGDLDMDKTSAAVKPAPEKQEHPSQALAAELAEFAPPLTQEQESLLGEVEKEVREICEVASKQCGSGKEMGELLQLGALQLGVASVDGEVDFVYVAKLAEQLSQLCVAIRSQLERPSVATSISAPTPDGLFNAPGLSFTLKGVRVKLLLTQKIPGPQPTPEAIVQDMSALHGREIDAQILSSVPKPDAFRQLLKVVRHWAKQRGIYGGLFGFLSGTAWAICCARVCQMNPSLELFKLTVAFFQSLSRWDWRQPVMLLPGGALGQAPVAPAGVTTPVASLLVLLPVGVNLSATPHVNESAMRTMQQELRRACKIIRNIESGTSQVSELYSRNRFFQRHRHYLQFDFMAATEDIMMQWRHWGRQHLQEWMIQFESMLDNQVTLRPWPEWYEFKDQEWPHSQAAFIGLCLEKAEGVDESGGRTIDLREAMVKFLQLIAPWPQADKHANRFELLIKPVRQAELEQWINAQQLTRNGSAKP